MESLFTDPKSQQAMTPLAERMRPRNLSEVAGQPHIVSVLRELLQRKALPSIILWGPPGCGKTTIARLLAGDRYEYVPMSAVLAGVKDVREAVAKAKQRRTHDNRGTLLFLDEIHRFNKAQQDVLLPHVEAGTIVLVGATTENPSFEVVGPLLSRCRVLTLNKLDAEAIAELLERAVLDSERGLGFDADAVEDGILMKIAQLAAGDARFALNTLEVCAGLVEDTSAADGPLITSGILKRALAGGAHRALLYDKGGDEHFNLISALHKSVRGSDPDAALYWMARMLEAGEDPKYLVRRMVRMASEDIGLADPWALVHAVTVKQAVEFVGMPECNNALAQLCVYLACAPKSNAMYETYHRARDLAKEHGALAPPLHIRNAPTKLMKELGYGKGYKYAQEFPGGFVPDNYWPDELKDNPPRILKFRGRGAEKTLSERLRHWWGDRFVDEEDKNDVHSRQDPVKEQAHQDEVGQAAGSDTISDTGSDNDSNDASSQDPGTTAGPGRRPLKNSELKISRKKLPHWELMGSAYLITWRLKKDSPELTPDERTLMQETIQFGSNKRYQLYAFTVMNDHVHVIIRPLTDEPLNKIIHTWNSFSTNKMQRDHGRQGQIWDTEYHDRIIRDESDLNEKCEYVLNNAQRRWPDQLHYPWQGWE